MPNYPVVDATWEPLQYGSREWWEALNTKKVDHVPSHLRGVPVNATPLPNVGLEYDPLAEHYDSLRLQQRIHDVDKEVRKIDEELDKLDDLGVVPSVQVAQPYIPSEYGERLPRSFASYAPASKRARVL